MPSATSKLREIANPAAVGWEWTDTYYGDEYEGVEGAYQHQISWVWGADSLQYGTRGPGRKNWTNTNINSPGRFGFDGTLEGARRAAHNFYNETEEEA